MVKGVMELGEAYTAMKIGGNRMLEYKTKNIMQG